MLWEELQVGTNADATQNVDSSKNDHPILAPLKANFDDTVLLLLDLSLDCLNYEIIHQLQCLINVHMAC